MKLGIIYSVFTVFLWALYDVLVRFIGVVYDAQPYVFVSFTSLMAALTLLVVAGKGTLGLKTIKQMHTWGFSFISVFMDIVFIFILLKISTTEANLMIRLSIIATALICRYGLGRAINPKNYFGYALVFAGFLLVAINLPEEVRAISIFLTLIMVVCQSLRTYITETHPASNEASSWLDNCRVTGYVVLVTSFAFIIMGLLIAYTKTFLTQADLEALSILNSFPNLADFVDPHTIIGATLLGVFNVSLSSYFYFQATKKVGSDTFLMVGALLPVFTYVMEVFADKMGWLELTTFAPVDLLAGVLIIAGALWSIYVKVYSDKKQKKLAPKAKEELLVLRSTIDNTVQFCNDDEDLVAKTLGIGKRTIKSIMTTEKTVSKDIKHKVIMNHAKNVAGWDHLTGALNQSSFHSKLKALSKDDKALVVFIDLDKFKPVNDTYGHKAGDSILQGVADRLMAKFDAPHIIARLGGDEFCAIIYNVDSKDDAKIVKKIKKLVDEPFIVEGIEDEISVGCSIGSAHYPTEGKNGIKLKEIADKRMYEDKEFSGVQR